jgi:S-adenosylmethionine uptake transporter
MPTNSGDSLLVLPGLNEVNYPPSSHSPNSTVPLLAAMLGISTYSGMDVLMKGLSIELGVYNAMLWRTLIALFFSAVMFFWNRSGWPEKNTLKLHLWRGLVTSFMAFLFFWGLVYVPIAEAIALSFIAPLIALYLAVVLLGEKIGSTAVMASLIGFAGALVIVGGKLGGDYSDNVWKGIAAILFSAVLYAYNLILQRQQAIIAKPFEIAFFQNGTVVTIYLLLAPLWAVVPPTEQLPALFFAAVLGFGSLLLLSWSYARAEARILIPVEYTAFIWAALFGYLVFDESVTLATITGTVLIVVGCLVAARQQPRAA